MKGWKTKIAPKILVSEIKLETGLNAVLEHKFHPDRKWRFDLAIPALMIGIEIEGGNYKKGRHTRGKGYANDCEKYNAAQVLGWKVLRYTHADHNYGHVTNDLKQILKSN